MLTIAAKPFVDFFNIPYDRLVVCVCVCVRADGASCSTATANTSSNRCSGSCYVKPLDLNIVRGDSEELQTVTERSNDCATSARLGAISDDVQAVPPDLACTDML